MRTSRASKQTEKVLQALSPPARRQTRSSANLNALRGFAYDGEVNSYVEPKSPPSDDDVSSLSSVNTVDIEDILEPPAKRRKSKVDASPSRRTSSRPSARVSNKTVEKAIKTEPAAQKARRTPARKIKDEDGSYRVEPPSNWETMYSTVKKMREANPTAPVDTMGCAELYWRASSPRDRRFQTLVALMLSSQTKDTVTAVAMQRLHTELGDGQAPLVETTMVKDETEDSKSALARDSTLNLENILSVSPERLNEMIWTVGFHNNKTKYIKAAAVILRDQYNSDIPSTAEELMKLPGVGPKMAYLCMSAAWGKHEGIGVDVHVHRITNLWGWNKTKNPEETRKALESWLPKDKWHEINKLLVGLGQTILKYAGLLRSCLIDIKYERSRIIGQTTVLPGCARGPVRETRGYWTAFVDKFCNHPRLPTELFLTSSAVRNEIAPWFFGLNKFSVILYSKSDFYTFREATLWGMEHLKYLHMDLGPRDKRFLKLSGGIHRTVIVKDLEVATKLMCAMDPFPTLSQCAIHLNQLQDGDIRPVVKRSCWRLTNNLGDKPPFPFLRLPKEVQLIILEQLLINQPDPYTIASESTNGIVTLQDRSRQRPSVYPLTCCGTCSPLRAMCFCYARQTAFSTTCSCFSSPTPYFLVSRGFYEDARRVFFSKNNFAFMDEDPELMMRLLHYIPTSSFMQIRHLTFKFPLSYRAPARSVHRTEDAALLSWSVLRRFIREHFDLSRLSLTIVDLGTKNQTFSPSPSRGKYLRKLLKSFADLNGLRDFRVYLADDRLFEKEAERTVMGPACIGRSRPSHMPFIGKKHLTT
ncbi:Endonuclease III-like protein 1 [Aspergillus hancockii]|nr:Endonuclease III-like protein 1 [Aspergillus hancockii]